MRKLFQLSPIFRISAAIVGLMLALILAFDSLFDLLPSDLARQIEIRKQTSFAVSDQIAHALQEDDLHLQNLLDQLVARNPAILSIGVRRGGQGTIAQSGKPSEDVSADRNISTPTRMIVPLLIDDRRWGDAEVQFKDDTSLRQWFGRPTVKFTLLFSTIGLLAIFFYLKKVLNQLDPSNAVPQRVQKAFDTLAEAVVLIGPDTKILLSNSTFTDMNAGIPGRIEGKSILRLNWLIDGLSDEALGYPWEAVIKSNHAAAPRKIKVNLPSGSHRELIMYSGPIDDGTGVARGCLMTFDDVTELSEANSKLEYALKELQLSRDKIEEQNLELQKHASIDPLTGCINRRSFFAQAEPLFQKALADGEPLHCIMADIDHFKAFNDKYGHSVGDAVIQQVSGAMRRSLRGTDLLCRYGGEEFCILLVGPGPHGTEFGERMRDTIETEAGPGVRAIDGLRVTSSFGVAVLDKCNRPATLAELIDQADKALYDAKHSGRNRVVLHRAEAPPAALAQPGRAA